MKRIQYLIVFLILASLFAVGWVISQSGSQQVQAVQPSVAPPRDAIDVDLLQKRWGRVFVPADGAAQAYAKVTSEQALVTAYQNNSQLKQATTVYTSLGYLSDPGLNQAVQAGDKVNQIVADSGLVWILTFEGIQTVSSGPPGVQRSVSNELNVVISAVSGEKLYEFTYR